MASIIDNQRDGQVREILEQRFLRYRRDPGVTADPDDVEVTPEWSLTIPATPCLEQAADSFRRFCSACMDVELAAGDEPAITLAIAADAPAGEGFRRTVTAGAIMIESAGERGLLAGAMRLLHDFAMRRAPIVAVGERTFTPAFHPRIGNTVFLPAAQRLDNHEFQFSDDYLTLMSFFGINGIHVYANFWEFCHGDQLPELTAPGRDAYLQDMQAFIDRTARFGIDVYLVVMSPLLPDDHEVFREHPAAKGSFGTMMEDFFRGCCLCSSDPDVLTFYEQAFTGICRDVDGLGGLVFVVGGEGFFHCYTRPAPPYDGATNCPNCSSRNPSADVAGLMNRIGAAVKPVDPQVTVMCWPYSAFTWSGEDKAQIEMIEALSADVELLSNLATGDRHPRTGASLFDYNIMETGPSSVFRAQTEALAKHGKRHYAKIECATTPLMFQHPMIPVPYRWARRAAEMKAHGVAGYISHWRFFGFNGNLAEEILAASVWEDIDVDTFLEAWCRREYGMFAPQILEGWRRLSDAWALLPYSATLCGGRQYYMKGPIFTGPAHPFILDVQNDYGLHRGFRALRGDARESFSDETRIQEVDANASPTYVSDLLWTMPVGVERFIGMIHETVEAWDAGCDLLHQSLPAANPQASTMLGLGDIFAIHFRTTWNLARFYELRDRCFGGGGDQAFRDSQFVELQDILTEEIANSERALPLIDRDPMLGYGYCYGIVYDARMVQEKIDQCRYVRDQEIPELAKLLRFHLDGVYP